jgi:hypothetical protein
MNEIKEALVKLVEKTVNGNTEWYKWKKIDESKIPFGIKLNGLTELEKNIDLKNKLSEKWNSQSITSNEKKVLVDYYISMWGGIHTNSHSKIDNYTNYSSDKLISLGVKGIASWSKALCIRDPNKFAIYDARVASALNFLQINYDIKRKYLFPILPSRNNTISKGNEFLKIITKDWNSSNTNFYNYYNTLLADVVSNLDNQNIKLPTVEMILFAKSIELTGKQKNNNSIL